jgi:hypothetical protein
MNMHQKSENGEGGGGVSFSVTVEADANHRNPLTAVLLMVSRANETIFPQ